MPCKANVDVVLTPDVSKNPVKWSMEICGSGMKGGYGSYPHLVIPYEKPATDHHLVYLIDNPAGSTWHFAKDAAALWVNEGPNDPTTPSTDPHVPVGSIHTSNPSPPNPATADTQLSFTDKNNSKDQVTLHYTLNFVNGQQKASTLDPIIDNGGCCTRFSFSGTIEMTGGELALYLVVAFLAGMVALMGIRAMRKGA